MSMNTRHPGILLGFDGSTSAEQALRWAVHEAVMRNVELTIVNVVSTPGYSTAELAWPGATSVDELRGWREDQGRALLDRALKLVEHNAAVDGCPRTTTELLVAAPVPVLAGLSENFALVVVGCRGRGRWRRGLLGSVSTGLVHHAHCPVAVIHDEEPSTPDRDRLPVLVGIDGSPASELATAMAFDEASWRGVDLVALHAWSDTEVSDIPSLESSALEAAAEEILAERLAGYQQRYPEVTVHRVVEWDEVVRHLLDRADSAQLVVVGSHGRGGFAGMLLGSVSTAVVHAARVPVIVARQFSAQR